MFDDKCSVCKGKIEVMCRKGTSVCSENCAKKRGEQTERQFALAV